MAGYVVVRDGYVRTYAGVWFAVSGARPVLTDENGTLCCCGQGGCCDSCLRASGVGLCPLCCFTVGEAGDLPTEGYWFARVDDGPDFWTIEVTQTGAASWVPPNNTGWSFPVTVRERCRVNNFITDTTISDTARMTAGRYFNGATRDCNQLHTPASITPNSRNCFPFGGRDSMWGVPPTQQDLGGGQWRDPFGLNPSCYEDTVRNGSWTNWTGLVWTVQYYYRVILCAQRCENDCTTCP